MGSAGFCYSAKWRSLFATKHEQPAASGILPDADWKERYIYALFAIFCG